MRYLMFVVALACLSGAVALAWLTDGEQPDTPTPAEPPLRADATAPKNEDPPTAASWSDPITLTPDAAKQVERLLADHSLKHNLRASVTGDGCTGFYHRLDIDDKFDPVMDLVFVSHGVKVVIDKKSALFMGGSVIDWVDDGAKQAFRIANPNSKGKKEAKANESGE